MQKAYIPGKKALEDARGTLKQEDGSSGSTKFDGGCLEAGKRCAMSVVPPPGNGTTPYAMGSRQRTEDKNMVLKKVLYKLVCRGGNEKMLTKTPHRDYLDLAAIYRVPAGRMHGRESSFVVQNRLCNELGITLEELDAAAYRNTKKEWFKTGALDVSTSSRGTPFLYEVIGGGMLYGSNALLYPECLDEVAGMLHDDLYILAFNMHQLIAGPAAGVDAKSLARAAYAIGHAGVPLEYSLSNSVYMYIRSARSLVVAHTIS